MKTIPLTRGYFAKVDDEDYEKVAKFRWFAWVSEGVRFVRAIRTDRSKGYASQQSMARFIMEAPKGKQVDHINGDGLDNRRCNLRICTNSQNCKNRGLNSNNKSGYKGVIKSGNKWVAQIRSDMKQHYLGTFEKPEEAAYAYNQAALKYNGEFAKLNIIKHKPL